MNKKNKNKIYCNNHHVKEVIDVEVPIHTTIPVQPKLCNMRTRLHNQINGPSHCTVNLKIVQSDCLVYNQFKVSISTLCYQKSDFRTCWQNFQSLFHFFIQNLTPYAETSSSTTAGGCDVGQPHYIWYHCIIAVHLYAHPNVTWTVPKFPPSTLHLKPLAGRSIAEYTRCPSKSACPCNPRLGGSVWAQRWNLEFIIPSAAFP